MRTCTMAGSGCRKTRRDELPVIVMILASIQVSSATPAVEISPGVFLPVLQVACVVCVQTVVFLYRLSLMADMSRFHILTWLRQLGTCSTCADKTPCCGTNLTASIPAWIGIQGTSFNVAAIDTQLRYNQAAAVASVLESSIGKPRSQLWITTKIPPKIFCNASDPKATALSLMRENLDQLRTNYVDLALLHEPCDTQTGLPHPSDQLAWEAMMMAVQKGWARAIGVDRFNPVQIDALRGTKPAVLMAEMSMSSHDEASLEYCQRRGITYNAFGVMHGCKFSDPVVEGLAMKYNASTSQICLVWTRQRGATMALGVGTDPAKITGYVQEDLDIFSFNLTKQEMIKLNSLQSAT